MEELNVVVNQVAGKIDCNFAEIKEALALQMSAYTSLEVTEDKQKDAKADLATLRKIKKAVDEKRKEVKEKFLEPYEEFESEVKEIIAIIDEPINLIDSKLKAFDKARAAEKLEHVKEIYNETVGEYQAFLPFESIFNPKWTNATYKDSDIVYDIQEKIVRVMSELNTIEALNSEIHDQLIEVYKNSGNNLQAAVQRNTQYIQDKAKVTAQIEEETKAKEEAVAEEKVENKSEQKDEPRPSAESMGNLNDLVKMTQTVHIIISKSDLHIVKNVLDFSDIKYQVLEG